MSAFTRKPRSMEDLLADPDFRIYVGRLMGAGEMVSHWLIINGDEKEVEMGKRFAGVLSWFFVNQPDDPWAEFAPKKASPVKSGE